MMINEKCLTNLTDEFREKLQNVYRNRYEYTLENIFSNVKKTAGPEEICDTGRVFFWKAGQNMAVNSADVYVASPLAAAIMAKRWDLVSRWLKKKAAGNLKPGDIEAYQVVEQNDIFSPGNETRFMIIPLSDGGHPASDRFTWEILSESEMPEDVRKELVRYLCREGFNLNTIWGYAFSDNPFGNVSPLPLERAVESLSGVVKADPDILSPQKKRNVVRAVMERYSSGQVDASLMGEDNLKRMAGYLRDICREPLTSEFFWRIFGTSEMSPGSIWGLIHSLEMERLVSLWKLCGGQKVVLDLKNRDEKRLYEAINDNCFEGIDEDEDEDGRECAETMLGAYRKLVYAADHVEWGSRQKNLMYAPLLKCGTAELLTEFLEKNAIRKEDVKDAVRVALEENRTSWIPLLILKRHGEWDEHKA